MTTPDSGRQVDDSTRDTEIDDERSGDPAMSYATGGDAVDAPAVTVGDLLRLAGSDASDDAAFVVRSARRRSVWTFGELLDDAGSIARWLVADGRAHTPVVVWAPNTADVVLAQMAAALAGCTLVPLNPSLRADEVGHALRVSGARLALVADEYRGERLPEIVGAVAEHDVDLVAMDGTGDRLLELGRDVAADVALPEVRGEHLAQIQFTSGTTGPSKGVHISHRAMTLTGAAFADRLGLQRGKGLLNPMPLFHTAGNVLAVMGTMTARAPHVVLQFSPDATLDAIGEERPAVVSLAPTLLHLVQGDPRFGSTDTSSIETVFTGGMTISPRVVDEVERGFGARLAITFGMTETCGSAIMTAPTDPDEDRRTTVGRVLSGTEAKVVDAEGNVVGVGRPGELCVRGPRITSGYVGDPDATAAVIDDDGWLHTGDEAAIDERGRFRITGRLKDMIKTGGENVSPSEVEDCITAHPAVDLAGVVGTPDARWGEVVTAYVVAATGATIDTAELESFCRMRLAPFKAPRRWQVVDELPQTASGKVQRSVLRARAAATTERST